MQILDKRWRQLADRERALLEHLVEFLQGFGAPPEEAVERERREGILEKEHPNDFLREVAIVDTPGTNAIIRHHEELSRGFVPRSDLVLFVTSSDRPFTESEREYLELIQDWGKKIVLVVNKVDLLRGEEDRDQVRHFVEEGVNSMLGLKPPIFFVSAYLARKAKLAGPGVESDALMRASGFEALERYVRDLLDEEGRVRLKLESPLGVVEELVRRYGLAVNERMSLLEDDFKMSENVESQLEPEGVAGVRRMPQPPQAGAVRRARHRRGRRQLRVQPLATFAVRRQERNGRRPALRPRVRVSAARPLLAGRRSPDGGGRGRGLGPRGSGGGRRHPGGRGGKRGHRRARDPGGLAPFPCP